MWDLMYINGEDLYVSVHYMDQCTTITLLYTGVTLQLVAITGDEVIPRGTGMGDNTAPNE